MAVTLKGNNGTYEGTSEDSKPLDVPVNTEFNELDTGKTYYFDGETWNEEPPCEGSGFTPTAEQLAAMNSGITTEDVAQIAANENNISNNTAEIVGQQNATTDTVAGRGYAIINGQRLYMGAVQTPERIGDIWLDGSTVRESEYLLSANPLCGISTYKDTLNLATGACPRNVKKIELKGDEDWSRADSCFRLLLLDSSDSNSTIVSSHFENKTGWELRNGATGACTSTTYYGTSNKYLLIRCDNISTTTANFKTYLQQQYADNTPVCVWYILNSPTTETITVPFGNVGTVEGYLTQDGTPTPTDPIYPTANEVPVWG